MKKRFSAILVCALLLLGILTGSLLGRDFDSVNANPILILSNESPKVGDGLTVSVKDSEAAGNLTLVYSRSLLNVQDVKAATSTKADGSVTFSGGSLSVTFSCVAAGNAELIVKDESGKAITSVSKKISGSDENKPENPETPETPETPAQPSTAEPQFTIDGVGYVASDKFSQEEIPAGFDVVKVNMFNHDYKCISNGLITLAYLKAADNVAGSGTFFLLDTETKTPAPLNVAGDLGTYFMALVPESIPNENMVSQTVKVMNEDIPGYGLTTADETRLFAYGCDENKTMGWFEINPSDGSYAAIDEESVAAISTGAEKSEEKDKTEEKKEDREDGAGEKAGFMDKVMAVVKSSDFLFVITLAAIIIVIILLIRNSRVGRKIIEDDVEDSDENETDDSEDETSIIIDKVLDDEESKLGFFARHKKEKEEEQEWKRMSEMDLDDFSQEMNIKNALDEKADDANEDVDNLDDSAADGDSSYDDSASDGMIDFNGVDSDSDDSHSGDTVESALEPDKKIGDEIKNRFSSTENQELDDEAEKILHEAERELAESIDIDSDETKSDKLDFNDRVSAENESVKHKEKNFHKDIDFIDFNDLS